MKSPSIRSARLLLVALAAIAATGCGSGGATTPGVDQGDALGVDQLLERLPSQPPFGEDLMAIDLDAAREQLGLSPDADPFESRGFATSVDGRVTNPRGREYREFRLGLLTGHALPVYLGGALGALDGGKVSAVAATRVQTRDEVMIVATRQDFHEVAKALKEEGFEEDGDSPPR